MRPPAPGFPVRPLFFFCLTARTSVPVIPLLLPLLLLLSGPTHTHTHALSPVFSAPENYQDSLSLSLCGRERRPGVGISCRALSPVLKPFGASDCDLSHPSADGPGEKEDGILEKKDKTRGAELEIDEGKAD